MKIRIKSLFFLLLLAVLCAGGILFYLAFLENNIPELIVQPQSTFVTAKTSFTLFAKDIESGLDIVQVTATQGGEKHIILSQMFPAKTTEWSATFSLSGIKLKEGPLELQISCTDKSWNHMGKGNTRLIDRSLIIDTIAPVIGVVSRQHNLAIGGSGLAVYTLSEPAPKTGIIVGKYFFPGFKDADTNDYLCFFSFPYDANPTTDVPQVIAVDEAGNEARTGIYYHLIPKIFKKDTIQISDNFLEQKMGQFKATFPEATSSLDLFLKVNTEGRIKNRQQLHNVASQTNPAILWQGSFIRQPGAASRATFGDKRTYFHNGQIIDHQRHLGIDLASIARDKVQACNSGKIVFADFLGIYGNVLILDHGMGLQSLYAHLSQFLVKKGDEVKRGQIIARTGATGMAGGDHLHLGIILSGVPVNPVEWWDSHWIKNNITTKIATARQEIRSDAPATK
ncbi:MAG: M23 family metallopeptidase [Desulfoplanes sp.]|nr:M23 family metallopeptidase [Desulfoplanes sp.]